VIKLSVKKNRIKFKILINGNHGMLALLTPGWSFLTQLLVSAVISLLSGAACTNLPCGKSSLYSGGLSRLFTWKCSLLSSFSSSSDSRFVRAVLSLISPSRLSDPPRLSLTLPLINSIKIQKFNF
jgi:hypothetical protein